MFPHIPTPGRRPLLALQILPVLSTILYYTLHHYNPDPGPHGLRPINFASNLNINNASILQAVPFVSGPSFEPRFNVSLYYLNNDDGQACSMDTLPSIDTTNLHNALVIEKLVDCYPEQVALQAHSRGFDMVIYKSPFKTAGYSAVAMWNQNGAPIPIIEVNTYSSVEKIYSADISPSSNPYLDIKDQAIIVFMSVLCGFFGLMQLIIAIERLREMKLPIVRVRNFVCVMQLVSGSLRFVFSFDMCGLFHQLPYPFFLFYLTIGTVFAFGTILCVGALFHFALLASERVKLVFSKAFWFLLLSVLGLIGFMTFCVVQGAQLKKGASQYIMVINGSIAVMFQVISGVYFIVTRKKVVETLKL